jgi:hypothetical protein
MITNNLVEGCKIMEELGLGGAKALGEALVAAFKRQEEEEQEFSRYVAEREAWDNILLQCPVEPYGKAEIVSDTYIWSSQWGNPQNWVNLDNGNGERVVVKFVADEGLIQVGVYHPTAESIVAYKAALALCKES